MFLINHLITEAGFDYSFNQQDANQDNQDPSQDPSFDQPAIEFEHIKKYILYERLKQIQHLLKGVQFSNIKVDPQFYSILDFCQTIIDFFSSFEYPEAVRLVDNLVDGLEHVLKLKLPKRIPSEPPLEMNTPIDDFKDTADMVSNKPPATPSVNTSANDSFNTSKKGIGTG